MLQSIGRTSIHGSELRFFAVDAVRYGATYEILVYSQAFDPISRSMPALGTAARLSLMSNAGPGIMYIAYPNGVGGNKKRKEELI